MSLVATTSELARMRVAKPFSSGDPGAAVQRILRALVSVAHALDHGALVDQAGQRQRAQDLAAEAELDRPERAAALGDPLPGGHLALDRLRVSPFGPRKLGPPVDVTGVHTPTFAGAGSRAC